jgi:hypothetical protein
MDEYTKIDLISHFHPEGDKWDLVLTEKDIPFIKKHFPYLRVVNTKKGKRIRLAGKMSLEHQIIYHKYACTVLEERYENLRKIIENALADN